LTCWKGGCQSTKFVLRGGHGVTDKGGDGVIGGRTKKGKRTAAKTRVTMDIDMRKNQAIWDVFGHGVFFMLWGRIVVLKTQGGERDLYYVPTAPGGGGGS